MYIELDELVELEIKVRRIHSLCLLSVEELGKLKESLVIKYLEENFQQLKKLLQQKQIKLRKQFLGCSMVRKSQNI